MMTVTAAALVYGLTAWINGTGLIEPTWPDAPLEVNVTNSLGFAKDLQRCHTLKTGDNIPVEVAYNYAEGLMGSYCEDRITIHAEKVDLETPAGQTVLVHELVHWLQDHNGTTEEVECLRATEFEAYEVHHEWQRQMGLELFPGRFTAAIRSQCDDPVAE